MSEQPQLFVYQETFLLDDARLLNEELGVGVDMSSLTPLATHPDLALVPTGPESIEATQYDVNFFSSSTEASSMHASDISLAAKYAFVSGSFEEHTESLTNSAEDTVSLRLNFVRLRKPQTFPRAALDNIVDTLSGCDQKEAEGWIRKYGTHYISEKYRQHTVSLRIDYQFRSLEERHELTRGLTMGGAFKQVSASGSLQRKDVEDLITSSQALNISAQEIGITGVVKDPIAPKSGRLSWLTEILTNLEAIGVTITPENTPAPYLIKTAPYPGWPSGFVSIIRINEVCAAVFKARMYAKAQLYRASALSQQLDPGMPYCYLPSAWQSDFTQAVEKLTSQLAACENSWETLENQAKSGNAVRLSAIEQASIAEIATYIIPFPDIRLVPLNDDDNSVYVNQGPDSGLWIRVQTEGAYFDELQVSFDKHGQTVSIPEYTISFHLGEWWEPTQPQHNPGIVRIKELDISSDRVPRAQLELRVQTLGGVGGDTQYRTMGVNIKGLARGKLLAMCDFMIPDRDLTKDTLGSILPQSQPQSIQATGSTPANVRSV